MERNQKIRLSNSLRRVNTSASSYLGKEIHHVLSSSLGSYVEEQRQYIIQQLEQRRSPTSEASLSILMGIITFGSTLALSTSIQGKLLHISTGTYGPIPSVIGLTTIFIASIASHNVALYTKQNYNEYYHKHYPISALKNDVKRIAADVRMTSNRLRDDMIDKAKSYNNKNRDFLDFKGFHIPIHTTRICLAGIIVFKLLGGRFWAIAPSSYTHIGSFARKHASLPATEKYATSTQRTIIETLGRKYGCHTCGSHMILESASLAGVKFVGDHMPPKSVAQQINLIWYRKLLNIPVQFRFYPQCVKCSSKQGSILSKATQELRNHQFLSKSSSFLNKRGSTIPDLSQAGGGTNAHNHGFRPRMNHLTGGILAGIAVIGTPSNDNSNGQYHYDQLQKQYQKFISSTNQILHQHFGNSKSSRR